MTAYELTIPAKNKQGILANITDILADGKINIRAISITSFGESGFINIIVDDPQNALKALNKKNIEASLREVIAVLIEDKPGSLNGLIQYLASQDINIENAYGFVLESFKQAVFVIEVKDISKTLEHLKEQKYKTLSAESLAAIEPFHYMKY